MSIINEALKKASKDPGETQDWPQMVLTPLEIKPNKELVRSVPVRHRRRSAIVLKKAGFVCLGVLAALGISYYGVKYASGPLRDPFVPVILFQSPQEGEGSLGSEETPAPVEVEKLDLPVPAAPAATLEMELVSIVPTPQRTEISKIPEIRLTGIMMGEPPQALVNGRFVKPGDRLGKVKVVKIDADHVTFRYRGRTFKKWIY